METGVMRGKEYLNKGDNGRRGVVSERTQLPKTKQGIPGRWAV